MQPSIITGQTGPYDSSTATGWGQNANYNYKAFNAAIPSDRYTPSYEVHYSKPKTFLGKIVNGFLNLFKSAKEKAINRINFSSLAGYAREDLKGQNVSIKDSPVLAVADTDNDGKISAPEGAAFALFQDMLDEHPDVAVKSFIDLQPQDADGKITNIGVINSLGLLLGESRRITKLVLAKIRKDFDLDKNINN